MAPAVIDLISSSPPDPPVPPPSGQAFTANLYNDSVNHQNQTQKHLGPKALNTLPGDALSDEFLFLSDDFDTTIDLSEPILTDASKNKRRRLSHPVQANRPVKRPTPGHAPDNDTSTVPQITGRASAGADPIDLTSSPNISPEPQPQPRYSSRRLDKPVTAAHDAVEPCEESNPFTRSPSPVARPVEKPAPRPIILDESSDPFTRSPSPVARPVEKPAPRPTILDESSDPFASSSQPSAPPTKPLEPRSLAFSRPTAPAIKPSKKPAQNWDPISSSAPEVQFFGSSPPRVQSKQIIINIDNSESEKNQESSDEELPDITDIDLDAYRRRSQLTRSQSDVISSRPRSKPANSRAPIVKKSVEDKAREKEAKAVAKRFEKLVKDRERQEAKEAKVREKERNAALAEVNKLRTDKKVSTSEMMVDMSSSLDVTVTTQLQAMLEGLDVQFTTWDSPIENVIKWRRKVRSRYNDDIDLWEPIPLRLEEEKHLLIVMTADEFVKLVIADSLSSHVSAVECRFPDQSLIYLIQGLTPWTRKNRNLRNRQFASRVRAQDSTASSSTSSRRTNTKEYVPEENVEDALLQLQVMHNVLIHHTTVPMETSQWISNFTQHISTIPYKTQRDRATLGAGFCMESGQVKSGDDAKDTYVKMLQEIVRITAPIAYGVAAEFNNVTELVNGLEMGGPNRLEGVRKSANKDGAYSDRAVGQAVSRRIHKVFTGRDEASTDV